MDARTEDLLSMASPPEVPATDLAREYEESQTLNNNEDTVTAIDVDDNAITHWVAVTSSEHTGTF